MTSNLDREKLLLRVLCHVPAEGSVKEALLPLLRGYHWQSQLHRAIFRAIAAIPSHDPETLRQLLPAKLTRMGFPDVEWEELFAPHSLSQEDLIALVRQVLADG